MVFGLSQEEEDRKIKGRRGGCQLIKGVAVNKAIVIAIPPPRGKAVTIEPSAGAPIAAWAAPIAKLADRTAGPAFPPRACRGRTIPLLRALRSRRWPSA